MRLSGCPAIETELPDLLFPFSPVRADFPPLSIPHYWKIGKNFLQWFTRQHVINTTVLSKLNSLLKSIKYSRGASWHINLMNVGNVAGWWWWGILLLLLYFANSKKNKFNLQYGKRQSNVFFLWSNNIKSQHRKDSWNRTCVLVLQQIKTFFYYLLWDSGWDYK